MPGIALYNDPVFNNCSIDNEKSPSEQGDRARKLLPARRRDVSREAMFARVARSRCYPKEKLGTVRGLKQQRSPCTFYLSIIHYFRRCSYNYSITYHAIQLLPAAEESSGNKVARMRNDYQSNSKGRCHPLLVRIRSAHLGMVQETRY